MATKSKKSVVTEVRENGLEFAATIVPGESIRVVGRIQTGFEKDATAWVITLPCYDPFTHQYGIDVEFQERLAGKIQEVGADVQTKLALILAGYRKRLNANHPEHVPWAILRDAFLDFLDLDIGLVQPGDLGREQGEGLTSKRRLDAMQPLPSLEPIWEEFDRTFRVGEEIITGSYNLTYLDPITDIKAKAVVTYDEDCQKNSHHKLARFVRKNWNLNANAVRRRNEEESRYI
jgi:hypothetical protein